jgi:hypothetical protein
MTSRQPARADAITLTERTLENRSLNFAIALPARPWAELDVAKVNPSAALLLARQDPEVYFMVVAEPTAGLHLDTSALADRMADHFQSVSKSTHITGRETRSLHGLDGIELRADVTTGESRLRYCLWLLVHGGVAYQLVTWSGDTTPEAQLASIAEQLRSGFRLLSEAPAGSASPDPSPPSPAAKKEN